MNGRFKPMINIINLDHIETLANSHKVCMELYSNKNYRKCRKCSDFHSENSDSCKECDYETGRWIRCHSCMKPFESKWMIDNKCTICHLT